MGIGYDYANVKYEGDLRQIAEPDKQPTQDLGWTPVCPPEKISLCQPEVHRRPPVAKATEKPGCHR